MADHQVDILIIGGGLIGATLMHALAPTGLRCMLVDNHPLPQRFEADFDARSVALSAASVRIFNHLHLWSLIEPKASRIDKIHVSEQGRFGTAYFESPHEEPLGHVVDTQMLMHALYHSLDPNTLWMPASVIAFDAQKRVATIQKGGQHHRVQARLFVAADGSNSIMRSLCHLSAEVKDYGQHAVVANIGLARAHQHVAYERFTASGPMALLPLGPKRMSLVWSLVPEEAQRFMAMSEAVFLESLTKAFGYRLGRFLQLGRRVIYPLQQMIMPEQTQGSVVFIGNAAHTLHPVAGQGFNLGLRDVAMLAQSITKKGLEDETLLDQYQQARQFDQAVITRFTDFLINVYTNKGRGVALSRQLGLLALDTHPFLKQLLSRYASGLGGYAPDLVCGIPLAECL
ncbi:MAG: 2-octaprenyl-6-methoxyphenyl hydroxylase [Legionella sp.]|nr:MAG: 2-octaprenyl-6-methoxyphenyl hydroxylase [Legionella sp.]